ncbi:MAG: MMPL family transporter [Anaerolineales bacterium]|nr:MMPL family transporter [Anaerolineales bacterium]
MNRTEKLAELVVGRPKTWLSIIGIITIFLGYQIRNADINDNILSYLPATDPEVQFFKQIGQTFGGTEIIVIALECADVFTQQSISNIKGLTDKLKEHPNITHVTSLTNIIDIRSTESGLEVAELIDKIPSQNDALERLRNRVMGKDLYVNTLVSKNGKFAAVICKVRQGADHNVVSRQVKQISREYESAFESLYFSGQPVMEDDITYWIKRDMTALIPFVVILVICALYWSFRSWFGVVLPLLTVAISVVWTIGLMTIFGYKINMITEIVPVILISVGSAYGIHVVNRYLEERRIEQSNRDAVAGALKQIAPPIAMAGVTTILGFIALISSSLSPIKEFGVFTAIGVFAALILSLVAIPSALIFIRVSEKTYARAADDQTLIGGFLSFLYRFVLKRTKTIFWVFAALVIICIAAIPGIQTESDLSNYFKEDSPTRIAERIIGDNFGGARPIQIGIKGDLQNPLVLNEIKKMHDFIDSMPIVNTPTSIVNLVCEMNDAMNSRYRIPETRHQIANLWLFIEGNEILEQMVNPDRTEGVLQIKIPTLNYSEISEPIDQIRRYIKERLPQEFIEVLADTVTHTGLRNHIIETRVEHIAQQLLPIFGNAGVDIPLQVLRDKTALHAAPSTIESLEEQMIIADAVRTCLARTDAEPALDSGAARAAIEAIGVSILPFLSETAIVTALGRVFPAELYKNDMEVLHDLATRVHQVVTAARREMNILRLRDDLRNMTNETIWNSEFDKNFLTIAETLNNRPALVRLADYTRITGRQVEKADIHRLVAHVTGFPVIMQIIDRQLVRSQLLSLVFSLFCVLVLVSLQFESIRWGLVACIPIAFTIITNFALMRIVGIPLDIATTMIASIAIGIGIDYTIHFLSRFRAVSKKDNHIERILQCTYHTTGRAIVFNAVAVSGGFAVLAFSNLVPLQAFGLLTALTMIVSALNALILLPVLQITMHTAFMQKH